MAPLPLHSRFCCNGAMGKGTVAGRRKAGHGGGSLRNMREPQRSQVGGREAESQGDSEAMVWPVAEEDRQGAGLFASSIRV